MQPERWSEVERLYHDALAQPEAARSAFLHDACAGDDGLRLEVESLLRFQSSAEDFLERSALQETARHLGADRSACAPRIEGYTILETLGEGGMGVVYLAEQAEPLPRRVALKVVKPGMDSRQVVARFETERQALARMDHPHIAAVFDAGATSDGRPYFVMEFVDGLPVTEYCDRHRLSTRARLDLFVEICHAVQHAHQKGVIHRDLKPSNVLVSDRDGEPVPKVIDFGTAKAIAGPAAPGPGQTDSGVIVGTLEYMRPEQAARSTDVDTRSDVYSLGVILYELLVGTLPFDGPALRTAGYDEMRRVICESEPPRPSHRLTDRGDAARSIAAARSTDLAPLTRQLAGDLDWVVLRALEKDRNRRYATAAALAVDVERFLASKPVEARPPSAVYRLARFARRYRGAVAVGTAGLVVLVAGLVTSTALYLRADSARHQAEYNAYVATISAAEAHLHINMAGEARARLLDVPPSLRGWEWGHLVLESDASVATLVASSGCPPLSAGYVPSDSALVLENRNESLALKRCETLETWTGSDRVHTTFRAPGPILAIGADGDILAAVEVGSGTGPWDLHRLAPGSGRLIARFGPFQARPMCAAFSPDGRLIAVGPEPPEDRGRPVQDTFEIWEARTQRRVARVLPPKPPLAESRRTGAGCQVVFSPDSTRLATSGATVQVWRADSGEAVAADSGQAGFLTQPIAFSPDGRRLAIGRFTGFVDVLRLDAGARLEHLDGNGFIRVLPMREADRHLIVQSRIQDHVRSVAFSPDSTRILAGRDKNIDVWDVAQGRLTEVLPGHSAAITGVAETLDGFIVSADADGSVKKWAPDQLGAVHVEREAFTTYRFALSTNGAVAGIAQTDGGLSAWQLRNLLKVVLRPGRGITGNLWLSTVAVSADGQYVLAGNRDAFGTVFRFSASSGAETAAAVNVSPEPGCDPSRPTARGTSNAAERSVFLMALGPDGRSLAFRQGDCVVVKNLETLATLATLHERPTSLEFLPDGDLVVASVPEHQVGGEPNRSEVRIWDWRKSAFHAEVSVPALTHGREGLSLHLAISADGRRIAMFYAQRGQAGIVSVWEGDLSREISRTTLPVDTLNVALSRDGRRMATAGADTKVRVWDTDRGQLLLVLTDDDWHVYGLAFTPDDELVAGRSRGGFIIWKSRKAAAVAR